VVDEVLAVGDVEFQKKCLGKMNDVSKEGRTILFVSHNMNAIEQLCNKAVLLNKGQLHKKSDDVREVIHSYLSSEVVSLSAWSNADHKLDTPQFTLNYFSVLDQEGNPICQAVRNDSQIRIVIEGDVLELDSALQVGYAIYNEEGSLLYWSIFNDSKESNWPRVKVGKNRFETEIPKRFLNEGTYRVEIIVALYFRCWIIEPQKNSPTLTFTIQGGLSDSPYWMMRRPGLIAPELEWRS
jgi:lipopolysaccharide transport system ATP-binding protein